MDARNSNSADSPPGKHALLPQITRLSSEGLGSREIGKKLGIPKSTVGRWLRVESRKPPKRQSLDPAERIGKRIARYRRTYRRLIQAWRDSKAEKQVRFVQDSIDGGDGSAGKKKSIRTETRAGDARYFFKAMEMQDRIDAIEDHLAALQGKAAGLAGGVALVNDLTDKELAALTPDELENFSDDQLFAIAARLRAVDERNGVVFDRPLLTKEELRNMTGEQREDLLQWCDGQNA